MDIDTSGLPAAVAAAQSADVCVAAVGDLAGLFGTGTTGEGSDAPDLSLPGSQADLVTAMLDTGTPVVLVVISGRPYALGEFAGRCAAIVQAFLPGEEGAEAIAGVLSGSVTPSGRLPVNVPARPGGQPGTYLAPQLGRHNVGISNLDTQPLFPFGHGLTYTDFEYDGLELDVTRIETTGQVDVSVTVRNIGYIDADEVVQLYLSDEVAQVVRPVRELIGYLRVPIPARSARRVSFVVHAERTSFTGVDGARIVEPGWFTVAAGRSSEDLRRSARFEIVGPLRTLAGARVMTTPARAVTTEP
jgi:beta-glucosidase